MTETEINNMNGIERVLRLFLGCCLIGSVMLSPFSFEYLILLPLIGIYPCMTAIVGWDPLYFILDIKRSKMNHFIQERISSDRTTSLMTPRPAI